VEQQRRGKTGAVFNEIPELYDRVRPSYAQNMIDDLVSVTGIDPRSSILEIGCGTGQATLRLAPLGRDAEPEVYSETADLHEQFAPNNPAWGLPPLEDEVRVFEQGWGPPNVDSEGFLGPPLVRWYPTVQWFDGAGFADLLRSLSLYRTLAEDVRESLLEAVAERIRTHLGDRVSRRYLSVLRVGQRANLRGRMGR
jgi:SAM-dependent methyltransferase